MKRVEDEEEPENGRAEDPKASDESNKKRKGSPQGPLDPRFVFEEDLDTKARVLELPRKARLVFRVLSSRAVGAVVAWGVLPLFDIRGRLAAGTQELRLWPVGLTSAAAPEMGEWLTPKRPAALAVRLPRPWRAAP